jgi:hypothetical protein
MENNIYMLIKGKSYNGGSFPLLIQKEEEVDDPRNKNGVSFSTINPK